MESEEHHLIFVPGPGMGHIVAAVEVSKLLLSRDPRLSITFLLINDPQIHTYKQSLRTQANPNLEFLELPEAQPPKNITTQLQLKSPPVIAFEKIQRHKPQVKDAVLTIVKSKPNVVGFIVDMFCTPMIDVAKEFSIPTYTFFTSSATFLSLKLHIQSLHDEHGLNISEFKDSDEEFSVPGFLNHVPAKVMPSTVLDNINGGLEIVLTTARNIKETKGVLVNTFQELELTAIESLSNRIDKIPPVYPVGPIVNLNNESKKDDYEIVSWLDNQPDSSVVFLCFGSQGSFSEAQIKQLAVALERSGHRFLWSLKRRPPLNYSNPDEVLPEGFLTRCSSFGKVIGWAPQLVVLSHSAVGGFVSHCGWNSILESLRFGVPIAAWPMYAEQQVNAFQMVVELGLAVEIKMDYRDEMSDNEIVVSSEEIEKGIKQLMEKGFNGIREKVKAMKKEGERALLEDGSSDKFLGCLIHDILQNSST